MRGMSFPSLRVASRFLDKQAMKYDQKEKKESKVDRLMRLIRSETGLSRGLSEDIADAIVRGREIARLTLQKGWPIEDDGTILGPEGGITLNRVKDAL